MHAIPTLRDALFTGLPLLVGLCSTAVIAQSGADPVYAAGIAHSGGSARLIVKFRSDSTLLREHALSAKAGPSEVADTVRARAGSLGTRIGMSLAAGRAISDRIQVVTATEIGSPDLAARLATEPDVEYAVEDVRRTHFTVPNDPLYSTGPAISGSSGGPAAGQWYLRAPAGQVLSSINAPGAWDVTTGTATIVAAILDSGVRPEHPDLANRLLPGYDMVSDPLQANDGNGRDADPSDPGDWVTAAESNDRSSPFYQCGASDSSWHGTMTTSLVGATTNNGVGMAGVAWGVGLLPVRVMGKCGGYDSDIIAGMNWAAGLPVPGIPTNPNPARVINMSLGSSGTCTQSYIDAIGAVTTKSNPAVVVVAAGNSAGQAVATPANCPGVIAVGGLRHTGTKVGYADVGLEISISAPAGNCVNTDPTLPCLYPILAATNTGITGPITSTYTDSFNASVGTSFSAPLVTGTIALMLSANESLGPAAVKALLHSSARAFPSSGSAADPIPVCHAPTTVDQLECYCTASTCGAGMLDVTAAVAAAISSKHSPVPEVGLWAIDAENTSQSGRGFQIEARNGTVVFTYYGYLATGAGMWGLAAGLTNASTFSAGLSQYQGGTVLGGSFAPATSAGSLGTVLLNFTSATTGTITLPGESPKSISKFTFNGTSTPTVVPANGLWVVDAENNGQSGRGFQIEQHSGVLVLTYYGYQSTGNGMWALAAGNMSGSVFIADMYQYQGGTSLGGTFKPATPAGDVGTVTLSFTTSTTGTITLPGETPKALSKFMW